MVNAGDKVIGQTASAARRREVLDFPTLPNFKARWRIARSFVKKTLRGVSTVAFDSAVMVPLSAQGPRSGVCIVRLDAIGDFVLWLESAKRLRRHFQVAGVKTTLLANAVWASLARELDLADEVWEIEPARFRTNWRYRALWIRKISSARFAQAVQPVSSRDALVGDTLIRASKALERVGSVGDCMNTVPWLKRCADRWYTRLLPCDQSHMELLRNAEFMRGFGFTEFKARVAELEVDGTALPAALIGMKYAVLVLGASWTGRMWPVAKFAEIGERLAANGLQIVVVGSSGDRQLADAASSQMGGKLVDLAGRTTLRELVAILSSARLVLSNDTGPVHIAAACGVPAICILGGGHFGRFLPYQVEESSPDRPLPVVVYDKMDCFGCNWQCIFDVPANNPVKCVGGIRIDQVWRQVESALAASPPAQASGLSFRLSGGRPLG